MATVEAFLFKSQYDRANRKWKSWTWWGELGEHALAGAELFGGDGLKLGNAS